MDTKEKKELLELLQITNDEFDNIYTLNRSFKYKKNILDKIRIILDEYYDDEPKSFNKEYLSLVALRVLIKKYNKNLLESFSDFNDNYLVKYIRKYNTHIPKAFIICLASSNRYNYQRGIYYPILSISEHLLYFDQYTLRNFCKASYCLDLYNIYITNIEWINELSIKKVQNMEKFVRYLIRFTFITNDNCNTIINICKMYDNNLFILNLIINNNFKNEICKIYNKSIIGLINILYVFYTKINPLDLDPEMDLDHIDIKKLYEIVKDNISDICNVMYNDFIYILQDRNNIWSLHKRYSDELFELAINNDYYDIIIDHLNNFTYTLDINILLSKLFKKDVIIDNNIINNIFKNCKNYDIGKILDNINIRYTNLNSDIPNILLQFVDKVDLELVKKFFRINCYIKDLDKFIDNPYSLELYYLCNHYMVYPEEYLVKFPIDKKILEMRQFYYNNKNPKIVQKFIKYINIYNLTIDELTLANYASIANNNKNYNELLSTIDKCIHIGELTFYPTPYIILRSCLFKSDTITETDTKILNILSTYVF